MQVNELIAVLRHIERSLQQGPLHNLYSSVHQLVQQLASLQQLSPQQRQQQPQQQQINQLTQQLTAQRQALESTILAGEPPAEWPPSQRAAFDKLGASAVMGRKAADALTLAFSKYALDSAGLVQAIQQMAGPVPQLQQRVSQTLQTLIGAVGEPTAATSPEPPKSGALIHIYFGDTIPIERMSDLADWSGTWDHIIKTFENLNRAPVESPRLIEIQRGSLELTIVVAVAAVAASIASSMAAIATMFEKSLSAKKIAHELRKLQMVDDDVPAKIDARAEVELEKVAEIASKLVADNKWEPGSDANELEATLHHNLKQLAKFYISGGRLKFRLPAKVTPEEGEEMLTRARVALTEIEEKTKSVDRLLEDLNATKQLPPKKS